MMSIVIMGKRQVKNESALKEIRIPRRRGTFWKGLKDAWG